MPELQPNPHAKHDSGTGPGRFMVGAIGVAILLMLVAAFVLFGHGRNTTSNPVSTAGSQSTETAAPLDRNRGN